MWPRPNSFPEIFVLNKSSVLLSREVAPSRPACRATPDATELPGCQDDGSTQAVMVSIPGHSAASLEGGQAGGPVAPTHHDEFTQAAATNFRSRSDEKVGPPRRIFLGRLDEIS